MQRIMTNRDDGTLIAAGEVVELRFVEGATALSLRAAKLLHLLVDHAGAKACVDAEHSILISELNFSHLEAGDVLACIRELQRTLVELTYTSHEGELRVKSSPLLAFVDRAAKISMAQGALSYKLSEVFREILINSNHWAALSRDAVLSFESRYALRLYELIALRINLRHKTSEIFELEDLRRRLGVPDGKLSGWSPFRQKALEPALAEVNQLSGSEVSYEAHKRGRRVERVTLHWAQRDATGRAAVARELASSNAGRKARRDGTVEEILPFPAEDAPKQKPKAKPARLVFPSEGTISYGAERQIWRSLAEEHAQRLPDGHLPDLGGLADEFRAFCDAKGIPLDMAVIESAFIGFCRKYKPLMSL